MRPHVAGVLFLLAACSHTPQEPLENAWRIGPPPPETLAEIERESQNYYRCIVSELRHYRYDGEGHAIDHMEEMMKRCDPKLLPVRKALERERIHPQVIERVLRQRRLHAARFLTRQLQIIEAQVKQTQAEGHL